MMKFIYHLTMLRSHKMIQNKYGSAFWKRFKNDSDRDEIIC